MVFATQKDGSVEVNLLNAFFHSVDYFVANIEMLELDSGIRIYTAGAKWDVNAAFTGDSAKGNIFRLNSIDNDNAGDWGCRLNSEQDPNIKNPGQ